MDTVVSAFPDVSAGEDGRALLLAWIRQFCATYAEHAVALRLLSSADAGDHSLQRAGLRLLWRLADAIARGMTGLGEPVPPGQHPEFTALSCAMMLERICYLLSAGAAMPPGDALERVTAIFAAAFQGQGQLAAGPETGPPENVVRPGGDRAMYLIASRHTPGRDG